MSLSEAQKRFSLFLSGATAITMACNFLALANQPTLTPEPSPTPSPYPCDDHLYPRDLATTMPPSFSVSVPLVDKDCGFIVDLNPLLILSIEPTLLSLVSIDSSGRLYPLDKSGIPTTNQTTTLNWRQTAVEIFRDSNDKFYHVRTSNNSAPTPTPINLPPYATPPAGN